MKIKLAFFSFADIDNFGDILFSHIFKMEMEKRIKNIRIDFYSPSNYKVEGIEYFAYSKEKIIENDYDALIVFGGEVVHLYDEKTWIPIYKKNNKKLESKLPSDIIFDWSILPKPFKAWLSVGVRPIDSTKDYEKIVKSIESLDFISVRGVLSKKILENGNYLYNNSKIEITPDMGWLFPNLLDYNGLKSKLYKNFVKSEKYLIFQINNITELEAKEIALHLHNFKIKNNIDIVLLPVIRPWEDYKYLKLIYNSFPEDFILLNNDLSILELADILVHSNMILSSSLHASITGLAAGIPCGILNKWQGSKLQDLFGHQFRLDALKHELKDIPDLLNQLVYEGQDENKMKSLEVYSTFMKLKLSDVFDDLTAKILKHKYE